MQPRPYQRAAIPALYRWWRERPGEYPLIVMATGAGKTITMGMLIEHLCREIPALAVLVLAHRRELIEQTEAKVITVWPDAPVGVYSAGLNRRELRQVTIASRDTLINALPRAPDYAPALCLIDEVHNVGPDEESVYRQVIRELNRRCPQLMVVGFTATAFRAAGPIHGPGLLFGGIAHEVRMRTLLKAGFLMPLIAGPVDAAGVIATDGVPIVGGDFQGKALRLASESEALTRAAVADWYRRAFERGRAHSLFFCVSIAHAALVVAALAEHGLHAPLVTGKTPQPEREAINAAMHARQLMALVNVGVYVEGTDFVCIDCIVMLRATFSLNFYVQALGRGMRPDEANPHGNCLVMDYGENIERFGAVDVASPPEARISKPAPRVKPCPVCGTRATYFSSTCPNSECDHRWHEVVNRVCSVCGTECHPTAKACPACGDVFARHAATAAHGFLLSDDVPLYRYPVTHIAMHALDEDVLLLTYCTAGSAPDYSRRLPLGLPGRPGDRARAQWLYLALPGSRAPASATEALDRTPAALRPVEWITVDHTRDTPTITLIEYQNEPPARSTIEPARSTAIAPSSTAGSPPP